MNIWSLYRITNTINGKVYIGQAAEVAKRWHDHRKAVRLNKPTQIVHHAMIKHGLDNFVFEVIASCRTQEDANHTETELVKQYDSFAGNGKGYNATLGGMNAPKTEEWKHKVSEKLMGHEVPQETRDKVSKGNSGKVRSKETKQQISKSMIGLERTEEHRKHISEALQNSRALSDRMKGNQYGLGYHHTEEVKQRIGNAFRGRTTVHKGKTWKIVNGKRVWVEKSGNISEST